MPHSEFLAQEHITADLHPAPSSTPSSARPAPSTATPSPTRRSSTSRCAATSTCAPPTHTLPDLVASLRSGVDPDRPRGQDRPGQAGDPSPLRRPPRRPDRALRDDPRRRQERAPGQLGEHLHRAALATVKALGQNNIGASFTTVLRGQCKGKGKKKGGKGKPAKGTVGDNGRDDRQADISDYDLRGGACHRRDRGDSGAGGGTKKPG